MAHSEPSTRQFEPGKHPALPPPPGLTGVRNWLRENLFATKLDTALTLLTLYALYVVLPPTLNWLFFDAVFTAGSREECRQLGGGACWAFIDARFGQFVYGFYPDHLRWRVDLAFFGLILAIVPMVVSNLPFRRRMLVFTAAYPFIAFFLLHGGMGLETVQTSRFGGFMLTLIIGVTGIAASLPIGIALALGRRSKMPVINVVCVMFIEFIRGVPLITLLFVASTMLNYFLPPGTTFDLLVRVLIMVTLFSAAYIAEVVRGGLQALPKGQTEAAESLGLSYWKLTALVVLPQALKISIPGIVNTFIGLFKDTTLVVIIGLLDPLGIGKAALADSTWSGLAAEVYVFIAFFFFICCYSMSRYSIHLEKKLHTGHKR